MEPRGLTRHSGDFEWALNFIGTSAGNHSSSKRRFMLSFRMISDTPIEYRNANSQRKSPGSGRLSKTGVELSWKARVQLAWMDLYRRCGNVAHTCRDEPAPPKLRSGAWVGIVVTSYILPASVSWWNGDNHLLPFFCQIDVAKTFPPCFLPSHVASCVAV